MRYCVPETAQRWAKYVYPSMLTAPVTRISGDVFISGEISARLCFLSDLEILSRPSEHKRKAYFYQLSSKRCKAVAFNIAYCGKILKNFFIRFAFSFTQKLNIFAPGVQLVGSSTDRDLIFHL